MLRVSVRVGLGRHLSTARHQFDVVVAGGGMVGAAAACSLGTSDVLRDKSILLLEAAPAVGKNRMLTVGGDPTKLPYGNRVSALNPATKRLFERLGVWKSIENFRCKTVKQLRVWDACSTSSVHFEHDNFDGDVAYIVENELIVESLYDKLKSSTNVTVRPNSVVKTCHLTTDGQVPELELADGARYQGRLLVAADGANSLIRKQSGVHVVGWSYDQKAVVATLEVDAAGDNDVAWQRFTPTGPVALLPLTAKMSSLVWTTTSQDAERLLTLADDQFVDALNETLRDDGAQSWLTNKTLDVLGSVASYVAPGPPDVQQVHPTVVNVMSGSRAAFPLGLAHATHYSKPRLVLIGDSAHRIHPLAGQGVNLGFGDVATLTEVLEQAANEGADIGSALYLNEYESKRQRRNVPVLVTIDWLNRLYATKMLPFVLARSVGLSLVDRMDFLKKLIISEAST